LWCNVCRRIMFPVIWIIPVISPVWPILGVWNTFRCAIRITFNWIMVACSESADI
jgi:hypothetical protein